MGLGRRDRDGRRSVAAAVDALVAAVPQSQWLLAEAKATPGKAGPRGLAPPIPPRLDKALRQPALPIAPRNRK